MIKIVSMSPLPAEFVMNMLRGRGVEGVTVVNAGSHAAEEMKKELADADFVLGDFTFRNRITAETISTAARLKFIQQPSVGYQHIDAGACRAAGIDVANCAGANTVAVAEHTVMSALCLMKKIFMASLSTRRGEWKQMEVRPLELQGKTWGLVGMGRIGRAVAERVRAFGVRGLYYDLHPLDEGEERALGLTCGSLREILTQADILSLHCPLTDETRGLINEKAISEMKPTAVIINVARGEIIDEEALSLALMEGRIAGAALDVFSEEPLERDNPFLRVSSDNLILSPHVAGVTAESQLRIMSMTMENLARVLKGEKPLNLVN